MAKDCSIHSVAELESPVMYVRGVGPRVAEILAAKAIFTAEDLLHHLPFRYEDRRNPTPLDELKPGEVASVIGEVRGSMLVRTRKMPIFELVLGQGNRTVKCLWFNGTYLAQRFLAGQTVAVFGRVEPSRSTNGLKMIQPQYEILPDMTADEEARMLEVGRITPIYESLGGPKGGAKLTTKWMRKVAFHLLEDLRGRIPETLPSRLLERLSLPPRGESLEFTHFPPEGTPVADLQLAATPAQKRLIFEELFYLELGLELKRRRMKKQLGIAFETNDKVRNALREILPFKPTAAQKRALGEIVADMRQSHPMRRLLQGDVGSGKTIVAFEAMIVAIENGYQAALMAPTEILATQHYLAARKLLERSGQKYSIALLTGSLDEERKRRVRGQINRGEAQLVIGTHALIEEKVEFDRLGLVVIDEQHRFGVLQRFKLMKKPDLAEPDVLVMTATPIPRTLALSLYGDLDLSVLDELPPGRSPIDTQHVRDEQAGEVWAMLRKQVQLGHQAYIVYPIIEGATSDQPELDFSHDAESDAETDAINSSTQDDSEPALFARTRAKKSIAEKITKSATKKSTNKKSKSTESIASEKSRSRATVSPSARTPLKSATEMYDALSSGPLAGLRIGLLHGRLDADRKEIIMRRFQRGELDVLVSTTVIEVGVDVPNATMMVVEHADRFGLAQLHQLRGRVGRGAAKSTCVLMTGDQITPEAEERLAAMVRTQNGFELAELDLNMRGPGEFFGTRQAGLPEFRVANLLRDRKLLEIAKYEAENFVNTREDGISEEERMRVWDRLKLAWRRKYGLVEAG